ncbi:olfactory receptor 4C11-like [Suricata suricatta]|uniref:olfactory receptor 4C11-like n=1 Tax=Suricata suricatta TaxID=37032 RepID=UPI001156B1BF|nr:olfactory receptor 4C11-like [Suricata suricatta]
MAGAPLSTGPVSKQDQGTAGEGFESHVFIKDVWSCHSQLLVTMSKSARSTVLRPFLPLREGNHCVKQLCSYSVDSAFVINCPLPAAPSIVMNSSVTEFILLGLTQDAKKQKAIFGVFLILYLATLLGNFLIVVTIKISRTLGSPMYFFLFYLSFADACFSTTTAPKLIVDALSQQKTISYNECMTQLFAAHFFGCMEIFVLILMAFDRYVAICKPLRYTTIMSRYVCSNLVIIAWVGSCIHSSAQILLALRKPVIAFQILYPFQ